MDRFVNLHTHDTYSFLDGIGSPKAYAKKAKELGQIALGTTNHGNISNNYKHYKECIKNEIKPILGCELYIQSEEDDWKNYEHMTCLAVNNEGYANLIKIVTEGWKRGAKHPIVQLEFVIANQKGLLLTSGCPSGRFLKSVRVNSYPDVEYLKMMKEKINHFYIEVSPWNYIDSKGHDAKTMVDKVHEISQQLDIPLLATSDCHYIEKEQNMVQEILLCIQRGDHMSNTNRWKFDVDNLYLKTREDMEREFKEISDKNFTEALDNTIKVAEMVDFAFPKATALKLPGTNEEKSLMLKKICFKGMKERGLDKDQKYIDRAAYEIELIIKKEFVDYFLIVSDMCIWAKKKGILVGPARGSSAGSLVCYFMRITEVDPLLYDLMFERFIDINRFDLPDIDVDFEDERRGEVVRYLEQKYGYDKVSNIATFATFKGRNTIQDFGKAFEMPVKLAQELSSLIIERSGGDSRASLTIEDSFKQFDTARKALEDYPMLKYAPEIEGQIKNLSSHASGFLISNEPLTNFCAIYQMKEGGKTSSIDYADASDMGLIKMDILGLNTLTCIRKTLDLIRERSGKEIDIYNLPLDDPKVFEGFNDEKKLFGIFQFDGTAVNQVCRQLQPHTFEDLSAINALSRPGPMHGMDLELNQPITSIYIARKHGRIPKKTAHPLLDKITEDTQGVVIYQEQVMKVMREIGLMSWKDTADIRKNISRSRGVEAFNEYKAIFSIGAKSQGLTDFEIDNIWSAICSHGSWCVTGDTKVVNCYSNKFSPKELTIKQLYRNNGYTTPRWKEQPDAYKKAMILSMDTDGRIRPARIKEIHYNGQREIFKITSESGKSIRATENHRFLSKNGYKELSKFGVGDLIAVNSGYEQKEYIKQSKNGKGWLKGMKWKNGKQPIIDGRSKEIKEFRKKKEGKPCDHCADYHQRMETHHVTREAPHSILEWLCPGCHKKTEYDKGRTRVWQKGFNIEFEKIKSINRNRTKIRKEDVYDVEMENNNKPNFIGNGFVSHNSFNKSHSVSYSIISYWTMYLKVYHPIEYYCAMAATMNKEEKVRRIIKEYRREGNKLLSIDINRSKVSYSIDDNKLRIGFSQIKGMGEGISEEIVKKQPYKNFMDFVKNMPSKSKQSIGKTKVELLNTMGAFDSIGGAGYIEETLFGDCYVSLFGKKGEIMDICPIALEFNIFDEWQEFLKENIKWKIDKIKNVNSEIDSQLIMGIMYDRNLKDKVEEAVTRGKSMPDILCTCHHFTSKHADERCTVTTYNGTIETPCKCKKLVGLIKYCNFTLEDDSDFVTIRISVSNFDQFKKLIFEETNKNDILLIKGRMGDGIRMFFMNECANLTILKRKIENNESLSDSEKVLTGKLWRNIPKRK